jgi:hypothetical protein
MLFFLLPLLAAHLQAVYNPSMNLIQTGLPTKTSLKLAAVTCRGRSILEEGKKPHRMTCPSLNSLSCKRNKCAARDAIREAPPHRSVARSSPLAMKHTLPCSLYHATVYLYILEVASHPRAGCACDLDLGLGRQQAILESIQDEAFVEVNRQFILFPGRRFQCRRNGVSFI